MNWEEKTEILRIALEIMQSDVTDRIISRAEKIADAIVADIEKEVIK